MRDATIIAEMRNNAKRGGLLLAQFEYLKTRQEAGEVLLASSTWKDRLRWAIWPVLFLQALEGVQNHLLEQSRKALDESAAKAKIQIVPGGVSPEAALNGR